MNAIKSIFLILALAGVVRAQGGEGSFDEAGRALQTRLEESLQELASLRETIAGEKIPLAEELSRLEAELAGLRQEYQETTRTLDGSAQTLVNLTGDIKHAKDESAYLGKLFGDYLREFEAGLHVAERQRHQDLLDKVRLTAENDKLTPAEHFAVQLEAVTASLGRIDDLLGGSLFEVAAVNESGDVKDGTVLMLGPVAIFRSVDGSRVGTVESRVGSKQPAITAFTRAEDGKQSEGLFAGADGLFPLDPTMGNAHKMAETEETFLEHVKKGGPVMWPIFIMAGLGLLIALFKWLNLSLIRRPSRRQIEGLMEAVGRRDRVRAEELAADLRGPVGRMLAAGVEHMREPRELIEEVMYETVLRTRHRLESFLPFIAICAASAPLLGLLGTVTGIINTFKMITVFGSGDVKSLSGGISEALITTKFGLIVAIPSLLLHAFLSRKAKGVISQMETAAVGFVNQVSKSPEGVEPAASARTVVTAGQVPASRVSENLRREVNEVLREILGPVGGSARGASPAENGMSGEANA